MNLISTFRQQHDQIRQFASDISVDLNNMQLAADATSVRQKLFNLLIRLKIHNSLENDALHVSLRQHENLQIAGEASRLIGEAADISAEIEMYQTFWLQRDAIEQRPDDFIVQTLSLLTFLLDRFSREDNNLYRKVELEVVH